MTEKTALINTVRVRLATVWLDGCSGCHLSLLDMDERLIDLAGKVDVVYTPIMDIKKFRESVDSVLLTVTGESFGYEPDLSRTAQDGLVVLLEYVYELLKITS